MKLSSRQVEDKFLNRDITEIWNVKKGDLKKINEKMFHVEDGLHGKHNGRYYDYQIVDGLFPKLPDIEKAKIFVYGQWVHERIYRNSR